MSEFQGVGVARLLRAQHPQARVVCLPGPRARGERARPRGAAFLRELGLAPGAVLWSCREHEPPPIAAALSDAVDVVINNDVFPAVKKEETAWAPSRLARTLSALTVFFLRRTSLLLGP